MNTYEHDEHALGEVDLRWTPVLDGDIYCSPACGRKCKIHEYERAVQESQIVANQLGENWIPKVFENLGWYWRVTKGDLSVSPSANVYSAKLQFMTTENHHFSSSHANPRKAVEEVRAQLKSTIAKFERQYASTSLDPIGIE